MGYVRTDGDLTHLRGYGTQGAVPIEGIRSNAVLNAQSGPQRDRSIVFSGPLKYLSKNSNFTVLWHLLLI